MVFPIAGGNESKGYEISNSLRFNDGDSPQLSRTPDAGNRKTFTLSFWLKRGILGTNNPTVISSGTNSSNDTRFAIRTDNGFIVRGMEGGGSVMNLQSSAVFRDVAAWYHFVLAFDTTQSTDSNRVKIYQNGVQITDFSTEDYPTLNRDLFFNHSSSTEKIGVLSYSDANYWDGYMTEFQSVDGSQLAPTSFGEFDDNGVWIPKKYTGSYGTNGFFLQFKQTGTSQDSSGIGADTSGNDNHFAVTNLAATDVTEDTCTNNFATCNPLNGQDPGDDISEGNLILPADASGDIIAPATIGFSNGKWYMEFKSTIDVGHGNRKTVGVYETDSDVKKPRTFTTGYVGCVVDLRVGDVYQDGSDTGNNISTFADNDICSLFYDADNGNLYIAKNGTLQNSGSAVNSSALDTSKTYTFYLNQDGGGSNSGKLLCNFGSAPTGYTISSGNADANGHGNFEYNPVISSTNYFALCTKNLAEFG